MPAVSPRAAPTRDSDYIRRGNVVRAAAAAGKLSAGEVYEGGFANGARHGEGILRSYTVVDGARVWKVCAGVWVKGELDEKSARRGDGTELPDPEEVARKEAEAAERAAAEAAAAAAKAAAKAAKEAAAKADAERRAAARAVAAEKEAALAARKAAKEKEAQKFFASDSLKFDAAVARAGGGAGVKPRRRRAGGARRPSRALWRRPRRSRRLAPPPPAASSTPPSLPSRRKPPPPWAPSLPPVVSSPPAVAVGGGQVADALAARPSEHRPRTGGDGRGRQAAAAVPGEPLAPARQAAVRRRLHPQRRQTAERRPRGRCRGAAVAGGGGGGVAGGGGASRDAQPIGAAERHQRAKPRRGVLGARLAHTGALAWTRGGGGLVRRRPLPRERLARVRHRSAADARSKAAAAASMPIARAAIDSAADAVAAKAAGGAAARPSFDRPLDLRMSSSAFVDVSGEFGTAADVSEKGRHTPSLEYSNLTGLPPPPAARDGAAPPTEQGLAVAALGEKISTLERFIADQKANTSAGSTPARSGGLGGVGKASGYNAATQGMVPVEEVERQLQESEARWAERVAALGLQMNAKIDHLRASLPAAAAAAATAAPAPWVAPAAAAEAVGEGAQGGGGQIAAGGEGCAGSQGDGGAGGEGVRRR